MNSDNRFHFRRFSMAHDQCGMKIGTDGVLLGSWANIDNCESMLDIGTGCGLIAVMMAQRSEGRELKIVGVEIEALAAEQARINVANSPWPNAVSIVHASIQDWLSTNQVDNTFDAIVCNPPFFQQSSLSENRNKQLARHTTALSRESLFETSCQLLSENGRFSLILPFDELVCADQIAERVGLFPFRKTLVRPLPKRPFKRALIEYRFIKSECLVDELTLEYVHHDFTEENLKLTGDFYLRGAPTPSGDSPNECS